MTPEPPPAESGKRASLNARVERIFDHTPDTRSLFLSLTSGKHLRFVPGQFISITIPLGDETRSRPYSIASDPEDRGPFEICFNRVVRWPRCRLDVRAACRRHAGFQRAVRRLHDRSRTRGGTGVHRGGYGDRADSPDAEAGARDLAGAKIHLIYAAPDRAHILYAAELDALAQSAPNFSCETVIAPAEKIYDRLHELTQARWVTGDATRARHFYICGVGKGVISLRDLLRGAGYERRSVHYEQW